MKYKHCLLNDYKIDLQKETCCKCNKPPGILLNGMHLCIDCFDSLPSDKVEDIRDKDIEAYLKECDENNI